jgi:hypothetical protein
MPSPLSRFHKSVSKGAIAPRDPPAAWPEGIAYLSSPRYSDNVDRRLWCVDKASNEGSQLPVIGWKAQGPSQRVRIKPIDNASHPAHGQRGLFAAHNLLPDTFILTYLGYVHGAVDTDPSSDYDLRLNADLGIAVDASRMGNEARFINDYRGVSATGPNAEFRDVLVDFGNGTLETCIGVFVLGAGKLKSGKRAKGIAKGDEILVSYGKGFWNERKGDGQLLSREKGERK